MGRIIIVNTNGTMYQLVINNNATLVTSIIFLCLAVAFYALRSIGVFMLARKNEKYRHLSFLAFIPFAWIYLVVSLSDKIILFGKKMEHMGIWFPIAWIVTIAIITVYNYMTYMPLYNYLASGKDIYMGYIEKTSMTLNQYVLNTSFYTEGVLNPYSNMNAVKNMLTVFNIIGMIFEILLTIMNIFVFTAFFKKYWPQHMLLATILSFLGFFAIFAFVCRNKEPVNFEEYIREKYQMYGNPNNPYNRGQHSNNNQNNPNDDPFNMGGNNSQSNNNNSNNQNNNSGNNNNNNDDPFGF